MATKLAMKAHEKLEEKKSLLELVPKKYHDSLDVFQEMPGQCLPLTQAYDHAINLDDLSIPQKEPPYSLSPAETEALDDFLEENLKKGFIRQSKSPQASPMFFVAKKNNKKHACMDYHYLNKRTVKNAYPIPRPKDLQDKLHSAKVFTKLDLRNGYYNVRLKEEDILKAAFVTPRGLFELLVMFFGLCNAPATFQAYMNDTFRDCIDEGWLLRYLDDSLTASVDDDEDEIRTRRLLEICR